MNNVIQTLSNFKGKVYPDRSFSVGYSHSKSERLADKEYERALKKQGKCTGQLISDGSKFVRDVPENLPCLTEGFSLDQGAKLSQDSSEEVTRPNRYGLKGITQDGKRIVRNGAILLEQKYGRKRLGLVSLTIPSYRKDEIKVISSNWGEVTRRFFQKLKRHLDRLGMPNEIISCTEIQPKRYKKYGLICPHFHFVYCSKTRTHAKGWIVLAKEFRGYWKDTIHEVLRLNGVDPRPEVDFKVSVDCQQIKHSVAKYLSKYISKGKDTVDEIIENGDADSLPRQWWTATKEMKLMFKNSIVHICPEIANSIFYHLDEYLESGAIIRGGFISDNWQNREVIFGCYGVFSEDYYDFIKQ